MAPRTGEPVSNATMLFNPVINASAFWESHPPLAVCALTAELESVRAKLEATEFELKEQRLATKHAMDEVKPLQEFRRVICDLVCDFAGPDDGGFVHEILEGKLREGARAVRSLGAAGFQDRGGELWAPPVDTRNGELRQRILQLEDCIHDAVAALEGSVKP